MKKLVAALAAVLALSAAAEFGASYVLYRYYAHTGDRMFPHGSAFVELGRRVILHRLLGQHPRPVIVADEGPVYVPDARYGFRLVPGRYYITQTFAGHAHRFRLTVDAHGHRITAPQPVDAARRLIVTGDSSLFGWAIDDMHTVPWLLQTRLPELEVVNWTLTGYSTVSALLQLREATLAPDDIVVVAYQQEAPLLNVAVPGWMDAFSTGVEQQVGDSAALAASGYPYARLGPDGTLEIRHTPMNCSFGAGQAYCEQPAPELDEAIAVTGRLFDEIREIAGERLLVAWLYGADDDPVIAGLRARGIAVTDLRGTPEMPEAHDLAPYDAHPGPFAHRAIYEALLAALAPRLGITVEVPPLAVR